MSSPEIAAETLAENLAPALEEAALPSLYSDRAFWGMTITQFLGAFNDNLFKQLVLLLSITGVDEALKGQALDEQWLPMLMFAVPFLLFTGYAGYLADRYSKRTIIVWAKVAEIVAMAFGGAAFTTYGVNRSMWPMYAVLFFMATQSAFFGPAKYGILPEMLRDRDLPRANGFMLMTTFLAIIFGTAVAGVLLADYRSPEEIAATAALPDAVRIAAEQKRVAGQLWIGSIACIAIAVVGTVTSLCVRHVRIANPRLQFTPEALTIPKDMIELLRADRPLLMALVVSSLFWLLAGLVPPAVNSLGKLVLQVGDDNTSYLSAMIGVGIAVGCAVGGLVSRGRIDFRLLRIGSIGLLACLVIVAIPGGGDIAQLKDEAGTLIRLPGVSDSSQWLGFWGSMPMFLVMGAFTGLFAVPLQVFMQSRPPDDKKGRMIAVMNQFNWIGILAAVAVYWALTKLIEWQQWPRSIVFLFIALFMLPIAILYHPKNEALSER
jgi:acyl-[acyl-carrier-protein]-phospholipid O-acyltransferase/long-chain-fatty-acid--[acyl-carrier-protein] ligase